MKESSQLTDILDNNFFNLAFVKYGIGQRGLRRRFKYRISNISIPQFIKFCGNFRGKRILGISGSSTQLISMLSNKKNIPNAIYGFDYSPKQVAYNYFFKNGVKDLSYEEFCDFFGLNARSAKRNGKNKKIRANLIKGVPSELRKYLTYTHEMTKRDMALKATSKHFFLESKEVFNTVKKNIDRITFFVYDLNVVDGKELSRIFPSNFFDFIYLSNAPDWIYWHNSEEKINIKKIIDNIKSVSSRRAILVMDHLVSRKTGLS